MYAEDVKMVYLRRQRGKSRVETVGCVYGLRAITAGR